MSANDRQVGGAHYENEIQHWDYAAPVYGPGYFLGTITKYLSRWHKKNGLEDLEKAAHYLEKYLEINWAELGWSIPHARMTAYSISLSIRFGKDVLSDIENGVFQDLERGSFWRAWTTIRHMISVERQRQTTMSCPHPHGYVDQDWGD